MVATDLHLRLSFTLSIRSDFNVMNVLLDVYCEAYALKTSTSEKASVAIMALIAAFFIFAIVFSWPQELPHSRNPEDQLKIYLLVRQRD